MVGAAAHIGEATVPNAEVFVALRVVALGLIVFRKTPLRRDLAFALFAAAGLINGYALGETDRRRRAHADRRLFHRAGRDPDRDRARGDVRRRACSTRRARRLQLIGHAGDRRVRRIGAGAAILLQRYATGPMLLSRRSAACAAGG